MSDREPDPPDEREAGREWKAIAEAQMRAYLANQESNDEVLARWSPGYEP